MPANDKQWGGCVPGWGRFSQVGRQEQGEDCAPATLPAMTVRGCQAGLGGARLPTKGSTSPRLGRESGSIWERGPGSARVALLGATGLTPAQRSQLCPRGSQLVWRWAGGSQVWQQVDVSQT